MRIAVSGSIATDHLMTFGGKFTDTLIAEKLDKISVSFLVGNLEIRRGGVAGNIAYGLGCLGLKPLLVGCVVEPWALHRPFLPWLGWPMLAVVALSQGLRWWCITTLGKRWNTRVIVLPQAPLVQGGPYRWIHHPNYVAVVAEGFALPLVHTAWLTALAFTVANAILLNVRIRVENSALGYA